MANLNNPSPFFGWEGTSQQGTSSDAVSAASSTLFPWEQEPSAVAPDQGEFSKGLSFGVRQTKALGHAALGAGADLLGADEFAIKQMEQYQSLMNEAQQFSPAVGSIEEIDSPGKFVSWAAANLGQQMPIIASTLVTGGAGAILGRLVAGRIVSGPVAEMLASKAAQWGLQTGAQAGSRIGAVAGAYAGASGLETGATFGEQGEALKNTGEPLRPGVAITAGLAKGVLEIITPATIANVFGLKLPVATGFAGKISEALADKGILGRMAVGGGGVMATEGMTEGLQEVIDVAARKFVDENYDALGPEARSRILNSAAAGGIVGAVFGGVGGVINRGERKEEGQGQNANETDVLGGGVAPGPVGEAPAVATPTEPLLLPTPVPENLASPEAVATPQPELQEKTGLVQPYILFDSTGSRVIDPDAITAQEVMVTEALVPPENRTPAQQMLMKQEEQRRGQMFRQYFELPKEASPQLRRLVDLRGKVLESPQFRDEQGELLPAAQKKIDQVSAAIESQAKTEGVDITPQSQLNQLENDRYTFLMEKERTEGLSDKEYGTLERLISKANGEQPVTRIPATPEATAKLEKEIEAAGGRKGPLYADAASKRMGITQEQFAAAIAPVQVVRQGNVQVLTDPSELQDGILAKSLMKEGRVPEALYFPKTDTTYFFLNGLSLDRAPRVYMHEIIAHHGLRQGLPQKVWQDIAFAVKSTRKEWIASYLEGRQPVEGIDSREVAAEEYIAKIAEDGSDMPVLRKVIAILQRWLRSIFPSIRISDDEIRLWLGDIRKNLGAGGKTTRLSPVATAARYFSLSEDVEDLRAAVPEGYTMRILDRIPRKEWITRAQVEQGLKASAANKSEIAVVQEVLQLPYMGERFQRRTFEKELRQRIVPLQVESVDSYADYGLTNIGLVPDRHGPSPLEFSRTHIYAAPFQTPPDINHFDHDHYVGHARSFDLGNVRHVVEVQSDLAQKLDTRPLSPEQERTYATAVDVFNTLYKQSKEWLRAYNEGPPEAHLDESFFTAGMSIVDNFSGFAEPDRVKWAPSTLDRAGALYELSRKLDHVNYVSDERAADAQLRLNANRDASMLAQFTEWTRLAPSIYKRMVREESRKAAEDAFGKVRLASVRTLGLVEGWYNAHTLLLYNQHGERLSIPINSISLSPDAKNGINTDVGIIKFLEERDKLNAGGDPESSRVMPQLAGIAKRHAELLKWAKKEFNGTEVTDAQGNTWLEWTPHDAPVIAYASDAAQDAHNLLKEFGESGKELPQSLDKWNRLWQIKILTRVLTPLQLAKRYGLEPINRYIETVNRWANTKSEIVQPADDVVKRWRLLGKGQANKLAGVVFDVAAKSDEVQRKLTSSEEGEILGKAGLSDEALLIYKDVNESFGNVLTRLEKGLKYNAARETLESKKLAEEFIQRWEQTRGDKAARQDFITKLTLSPNISVYLVRRIHEIENDLAQLRNRNYFPYTRFGKYTLTVKAFEDGQKFEGRALKAGETAAFWTFESKAARDSFAKDQEVKSLRGQGFDVTTSQMRDESFAFLGMPPSLMDAIGKEVEMSDTQRDQLKEFFIKHSPGRAFLRHLIRRRGIEGFSLDAMRVYASYMMSASNHLARVEHYADMDESLSDLYDLRKEFEQRQDDSTGLVEVYNAFQRHRKYIMNPGNDLAQLRAMGFMWYLGFNPKSALVNLTQTPMVTYPYLAARYGDGAAVSQIGKAIKDAASFTQGKASFDPMLDQLYARGLKEGFLDESLATELAGISEGGTLQRVLPSHASGRILNQVSYYGSWLFRNAEKFTRAIAFTAAVRLEFAKSQDIEMAYQAGKEAVRSTLFEYAKWNRPEFMRGKKSVFFLFWTFMQHMSFVAFGGEGAKTAMRVWTMLALMAGLQGLPWAEDLLSLLDFGSERTKSLLGMKDPHTDLRTSIRELLLNITDSPDLIMHGLSRYWGLGPMHLLSLAGVPIPRTDVSSSTSMGRVIPGLQELLGPSTNPDEKFGRSIAQIMGPVFAMPYVLWKAYEDDDPNTWKRWERAMPTAMKSLSRAGRFLQYGEESFRGGGTVAEFDPHDTQQQAEIYAQAFGFSPTRINQRYEQRAAQEQMKEYFLVKRSMLLDGFAYAKQTRDREGIADVRNAIKDFNQAAPDYKLHITADVLARSMAQRERRVKLRTKGQPSESSFRNLFRETAQAYPVSD